MTKATLRQTKSSFPFEVKLLPLEVLHYDKNQPRGILGDISELLSSIKHQKLQQPIHANPWKEIDGVMHYIIDKGARRYASHEFLANKEGLPDFKTIRTIISQKVYNGELDIDRKLSQWAENSAREDMGKKDTVLFLKEIIEEEKQARHKTGRNTRGVLQTAVSKLCSASGKSIAWGNQYVALCNLIPEMLNLLDLTKKEEKLGLESALQLSRLPQEIQQKVFEDSRVHFNQGGQKTRTLYLRHIVKRLQHEQGKKYLGRPTENKRLFMNIPSTLQKTLDAFGGEMDSHKREAYIQEIMSEMNTTERTAMLRNIHSVIRQLNDWIVELQNTPTVPLEVPQPATKDTPKTIPKPIVKKAGKKNFTPTGRTPWPSSGDIEEATLEEKTKPTTLGYQSRIIIGTRY